MCTALNFGKSPHYFGRTLDNDKGYGEEATIMPRNFPFPFKKLPASQGHYAVIGMAVTIDNIPLFFEGTNEKGLSMAGLNFPGNAFYHPHREGKINLAPFELIPYILGECKSTDEAREKLKKVNVTDIPFNEAVSNSPLHWIISDKKTSLVAESVKEGLRVYENPLGVLTNNPSFDYHLTNLNNYMHLYEGEAENRLFPEGKLENYSFGMGALGMPGDFSSASRFIRGVYLSQKAFPKSGEEESLVQFFRLLSLVSVPEGCVINGKGKPHFTLYSSCCNTDKGIYFYTTCCSTRISRVDMHSYDLDSQRLFLLGKNT